MIRYEYGNCLRGYFWLSASSDAEAWEICRRRFMRSFPLDGCEWRPDDGCLSGRRIELKREIPVLSDEAEEVYPHSTFNTILVASTGTPWRSTWYDKMPHLRT